MSGLRVDNLKGTPTFPDGVVVTGEVSSTSFSGNLTGNVTGNVTGIVTGNVTGNIAGTTGSFNGNVSVGGSLSYGDVTNVDSVGVITARGGIKIGAGQSVSAVSGIITYYGDGSQLGGIESGFSNFVASGTIPNGATVIINTDGTISGVVTTGVSQSVGSSYITGNNTIGDLSITYDSDSQKIVLAYRDTSDNNYGKAIVGTVSGSLITFGSPVTFASANTNILASVYDSYNKKVVISFSDYNNLNRGKAVVGTVSGTSISFGSEYEFESGNTANIWSTFDSTNNKVIISYTDGGDSDKGKAVVGTVNGSAISFGSPTTFHNAQTGGTVVVYDSNAQKIVIFYQDVPAGAGYIGNCVVGTVSGDSITYGSETTFEGRIGLYSGTYDSTQQKVLAVYRDIGDSNNVKVIAGNISGTSITFGSPVNYTSNASSYPITINHHPASGKNIIAYKDSSGGAQGKFVVATVNGTTITVSGSTDFEAGAVAYLNATYDSVNKKVIIAYRDDGGGDKATAIAINPAFADTNLESQNYIGIAAEAISNGATGKINVAGGVNSGQTGLTTARTYYVQNNGSLGTSAGNPSVVAGTSISGTQIIVKG